MTDWILWRGIWRTYFLTRIFILFFFFFFMWNKATLFRTRQKHYILGHQVFNTAWCFFYFVTSANVWATLLPVRNTWQNWTDRNFWKWDTAPATILAIDEGASIRWSMAFVTICASLTSYYHYCSLLKL